METIEFLYDYESMDIVKITALLNHLINKNTNENIIKIFNSFRNIYSYIID